MKPITADNNDGRVLLALRAGEMTPGELSERGLYFHAWLLKAGYVVQIGGYYRITDAGRVACPFRNPLAAAVTAPAKQEINMPKENIVTRQEVLAAIVAAGPAGTTCKRLIEQFNCGEQVIYNHVSLLGKAAIPVIFKPEKGRIVAIKFNHLDAGTNTAMTAYKKLVAEVQNQPAAALEQFPFDAKAVLHEQQQAAPRAEELIPAMPELAVREETIEIKDIGERRGPITLHDQSRVDFGMFRSGRLEIFHERKSILVLGGDVVSALQKFLGLFTEVA